MLCWFLPYINVNQLYIYIYIYMYVSMNLPASPSHPSRLSQSPHLSSLEPYSKVPLAVLFTYGGVCFHATLSIHPLHSSHLLLPEPPRLRIHKSVLYACISIAALQIGSSVPSFWALYIYAFIDNICFSLSELLQSV